MNTEEYIKSIHEEAAKRSMPMTVVRIAYIESTKLFRASLGNSAYEGEPTHFFINGVKNITCNQPTLDAALFNLRTLVLQIPLPKPSCDGKEVEIDGRKYTLREVK